RAEGPRRRSVRRLDASAGCSEGAGHPVEAVVAVARRVPFEELLVLGLGRVVHAVAGLGEREQLGADGAAAGLVQRVLVALRRGAHHLALRAGGPVHGAAVLGAHVVALPHRGGGVVLLPELGEQGAQSPLAAGVDHAHGLGMAGAGGEHLLVGGVRRVPARIARGGGVHAGDLPGDALDAPEAPAGEDDLLAALRPGARIHGRVGPEHVGAQHEVLTGERIGVPVPAGERVLGRDHLLLVPVQEIHQLPHGVHGSPGALRALRRPSPVHAQRIPHLSLGRISAHRTMTPRLPATIIHGPRLIGERATTTVEPMRLATSTSSAARPVSAKAGAEKEPCAGIVAASAQAIWAVRRTSPTARARSTERSGCPASARITATGGSVPMSRSGRRLWIRTPPPTTIVSAPAPTCAKTPSGKVRTRAAVIAAAAIPRSSHWVPLTSRRSSRRSATRSTRAGRARPIRTSSSAAPCVPS